MKKIAPTLSSVSQKGSAQKLNFFFSFERERRGEKIM